MVTSYNTGSPSAQTKLTAIHSGHGGVVRDELAWRLIPVDEASQPPLYQSDLAQPTLTVIPGSYQVEAVYQGNTVDCGVEKLERNTYSDLVFILNTNDLFDSEKQYSAETDPFLEYDRRRADREFEIPLGEIVTPVKDPYHKPEMGSQLASHPLLDKAQFDGLPPQITPDPIENEEASKKAELQLQQQLQLQQAAQATPSASPSPFG
jgi:hypothetical protein